MFSTPSSFLMLLLVLLQLIAPLVHAHSDEYTAKHGIHLPGYEHHNTQNENPLFQAITQTPLSDASIISIATGIIYQKTFSNAPILTYIAGKSHLLKTAAQHKSLVFTPPQNILLPVSNYHKSFSTRAPPAHR